IQVPDNFAIQQLTLQLNITYPNDPDLTATLTGPDGTQVHLFSNVGNVLDPTQRHDFSDTVFDDNATTPIQKGIPPFNLGPYTPHPPLSVRKGRSSTAAWTLTLTNAGTSAPPTAVLNTWPLTMVQPIPSPDLGEPVADQFTAHFRIWVQDPTQTLPHDVWTA